MLKRLFLAAAALTGVVANEDFSSLSLHGKGLLTIDNINITHVGGIQPFSLSSWFQIPIDNPESAFDQMQTLVALRGMEGNEKEMWRFGINTVKILNETHTQLGLELNRPLTFTSISSPTYTVPLNTPVHVMMTWNGTLALYVNNIVSTYTTTWIQHTLTSTTMYIGATGYDSDANSGVGIPILPFIGTIQSLAYHATSLSSDDVNLIYEHGPYFNQTILSSSIYPTVIYIFTPSHTSLNYTTGVYSFTPITFNTSFIAPIATSSGCNELKNSRLEYGRVGALYFRCPDEPQVTRPPTTPVPTTAAPTTQTPTTVTPTTSTPTTTSAPTSSDGTTSAPTSSDGTTSTPTSSDGTTSTPTSADGTTSTPTSSDGTTSTPTSSDGTTSTPTSLPSSTSSSSNSTDVPISSSIPSSTTSVTSIDSFSSNNNINGTESSTAAGGATGSSTGESSTGSNVVDSSTGTTTSEPTSQPTSEPTSQPTKPGAGVIDDIPSSTGDAVFSSSSSSTGSNNTLSVSSASMTTSSGMVTMVVMMGLAMLL